MRSHPSQKLDGDTRPKEEPFSFSTSIPSAAVNESDEHETTQNQQPRHSHNHKNSLRTIHTAVSIILLFLNYFTAQYDKFILSYFQTSFSDSLHLSATEYGVLSGYATGIVYALLALPIAYVADYFPRARVWTLTIASLWWSLCVIFQSLSRNFWQVLLARIGMGIGQSCVEPLSISVISDLVEWRNVFLGTSAYYVGVYVGEAVSGQITLAFPDDRDGWRVALRAIGITGVVLAVCVRLVIRDPERREGVVSAARRFEEPISDSNIAPSQQVDKRRAAKDELRKTISYILRMRSFWLLLLSASIRQLAGNVFGYYMPSYLQNTYPDEPQLLSRYGIIVGVVGSVSVLAGGVITSVLWHKTKVAALYLTGVGGMISAVFVILMILSRDIAHGNQDEGMKVLYGTMAAAYLTAETWLGALNGLVALILPAQYKTFGLAIWSSIQVLVYSAGPEIMGLALKDTAVGSRAYTRGTQIALAVIIPTCYWLAGIGFLFAVPLLQRDIRGDLRQGKLSRTLKLWVWNFMLHLAALVIALFVTSIVYAAM